MNLRNFQSVAERRQGVEKELGIKLESLGKFTLNETIVSTRNCENMIGAVQIPLGLAGPLRLTVIRSGQARDYYLPLATTEGALVASVNRGCKAITESGGATVDSYQVGATRGPVFQVKNLLENDRLNNFLEEHFSELQQIAAQTSNHLKLKKYFSRGIGRNRYVRFIFDTQDAMGLNMVTIASQALVDFIEKKAGVKCLSIAGNYDVDKKPAWLNIIEGRGMKVWAEVLIPERILKETLKTTAAKVYEVWVAKCLLGSAMSGSMAFNAQFANIVAAIFLATGQDPAHVTEGSLGITTTEVQNNDLYVSVYLPDLMVGTVGGGTGLSTQQEALSILGVAGGPPAGGGGKNSQKLAEIIGGAVLAGEISLLSSLEEGTLARAHATLGRGK